MGLGNMGQVCLAGGSPHTTMEVFMMKKQLHGIL